MPCLKRLNKEIKDLLDAKGEGFQLFGFIENKIYGVLEGPPNSPYENEFFRFTITYRRDYPFKPPEFLFETKIFILILIIMEGLQLKYLMTNGALSLI